MKLSNLTRRLLDQATGAEQPPAAGGAVADAGATTEQQTQQQATGDQGAANLLQQAAGEQTQGDQNYIPEKFHVKKDDGSLDIEASARKLSESYANLERQRGNVELPPATPGEYTVNAPEQFKDVFQADDPVLKGFLEKAHAAGMSQKQVDTALAQFFEYIPSLQQGNAALDSEAASTALRETWKDEGEYNTNLKGAFQAVSAYAPQGKAEELVQKYGNDPDFIRLMASVGKEMQEDKPANTGSQTTATEDQAIDALMSSEAYGKPSHPDHEKVSQQVKAYFEKKYGTQPAI